MASQSKCNARTYPLSLIPYPLLVEKGGKFFARWSRDDALMRSRNRSILERPDRIETVDDAFLDALRSDDGVVRWPSVADLRDLGRRLAAWRLSVVAEPEACAQVTFRLVAPTVADAPDASNLWRLELTARPTTVAAFRALGAACRVWQPLCGMTDDTLMLEQSEMEAFLRVGAPALKAAGYGVEVPAQLAAEIVDVYFQ